MRILVTGGAGNIGRKTIRILRARGHDTLVFDRVRCPATPAESSIIGDIGDRDALVELFQDRGVEVVVHLASMLQFGCDREPAKAIDVNVIGTLNVLEAARRAGVNRVILSGTLATYGGTDDRLTEESPIQADVSLYGATKLIGEIVAQRYGALYGMDCRALRYAAVLSDQPVTSPGVAAALATIFDAAGGGDVVVRGVSAHERRHFCYAEDIALGTALATVAPTVKSMLFNIAGGPDSYASFQDIADLVRRHAPSCGRIVFEGRSGDRGSMDISRARAELGYRPAYSIEAAVAEIVRNRIDGASAAERPA